MKIVVDTEKAPKAIGPYSQAIMAGNFMFISGQIGIDPATGNIVPGGVAEQAKQVLDNIKSILGSKNLTLKDVVKTTVFLTNMDDFQAVNAIYGEYFPQEAPARGCVQVGRLPKDVAVEIEAIAYR